ncbi:hypothetical protein VPH35_121819 [Triticum aestivum]|uniref:uncharacterized protein n=1 Tax=Triticum aestivum TaxID=4565 RepID=UPI001D0326FE|nr:uncharacterized protein LOC123150767 [Triticum aestivum]
MPPPPPPPDSCGVRRAGAMALRSPSSTSRRNLGPPYSPPADSLTPTSQLTRVDPAMEPELMLLGRRSRRLADHLLAKLEKEGVEIDGKITSIIGDGIGRIQADAAREHMNGPKWKRIRRLLAIASAAVGFVVGVKYEMNRYQKEFSKSRGQIFWQLKI